MLNAASITNGSPFTATQRQELEHQALIFKYMVAGAPIPPELLYSIKRSLESSLNTSGLFPRHQPVGWGSIRVGFGRKADPEPGRCRRTDGKKWRCSKEAYPYSKYCERHMHRGRNRSRKPVELTSSSSTTTTTNASSSCSSYTLSPHHHQDPSHNTYLTPFSHPHSSSSRSPDCAVTPQNSTTSSLFSESGSSLHADNDYRYIHGMRSVNERALFPEASGNVRSLQHPYQELTMGSYKGYSELGFHSFSGTTEHQQQQQEQRQQHCFVLGTDFKLSEADTRPFGLEKEAETQKPLHHFFDN